MTSRKRRLSQQNLRAMGVSPSLMAHRVGLDGRSRLEQLTSEGSARPPLFLTRASNKCSVTSEGGQP